MSAGTVTPPPQPTTAPMTAEEFGLKYSGAHVEYVNGQVKEMSMPGGRHGKVCGLVAYFLTHFTRTQDLGHVFINDTFVNIPLTRDSERVYGPDVFFVSYDRLPKDAEIPSGTVFVVPNLVVEVRSPTDLWTDLVGKVFDYLKIGVPLVLVLDPLSRTASVCTPAFEQRTFGPVDELTLPEVLPGFAVRVADFFA